MKAVVLAGGKGTRLAPYTTVLPKPLMPVGDVPIIDVVLRQLAAAGFDDVTLAVGHLAELIVAYCGDGSRYGVAIRYSREEEPLGTAGPIALADVGDDPFLVMNGDLLTTIDFNQLRATHEATGAVATVTTYRREISVDLGVIDADGDRVTGYREKPRLTYDASAGIYMFEPTVLEHIPRGVRFDLPDLILRLLEVGAPVGRFAASGRWLDIGRHDDYADAIEVFEAHRDEFLRRRRRTPARPSVRAGSPDSARLAQRDQAIGEA